MKCNNIYKPSYSTLDFVSGIYKWYSLYESVMISVILIVFNETLVIVNVKYMLFTQYKCPPHVNNYNKVSLFE